MKKRLFVPLLIVALLLAVSPQIVSAHQHAEFEIGGIEYELEIGSMGEPVIVDNLTGVYLAVRLEESQAPVEGIEQTVKVEVSAGGKKKVMDLVPIRDAKGEYRTIFIPTIQTTYSYRVFGEINKTPFDYTFTCNPAGHAVSPEDTTKVKVSEGVERLMLGGAFGCPTPKSDLGFPEAAPTENELAQGVSEARSDAGSAKNTGMTGIVIGVVGLATAVGALMRKKQ